MPYAPARISLPSLVHRLDNDCRSCKLIAERGQTATWRYSHVRSSRSDTRTSILTRQARAAGRRALRHHVARPQAPLVAARPGRADVAVSRLGARRIDRPGRLLVFRADPRVRHLPNAGPGDRQRRAEPPGGPPEVARAGPLLPLVHLPVPAGPVRRADRSLLAVVAGRALDDR